MKRWIALIPLAVFILAAGMFAFKSLNRQSHVEPTAMVGQSVPKIALVPLEGGPAMDLPSSIKGPALINIFASWCGPCAVEHPYLMSLRKQGVRIIGIAYKDKPADTANFLTTRGDPYELVLTDPDRVAGVEFGISGISETFVVDSKGQIIGKRRPMESQADEDQMLALLKTAH
jgi:cytochrome c biogenesis protein CcmG/thiol:disulfide interchange protein DsbE